MRPLEGLVVLDFSTLLPGPMASLILAEAGAEVIRVERPDGDEMRRYAPALDGMSLNFALLNRGKKSLVLDLKRAGDRALLEPLLRRADILIEQFRPGVMKRLNMDFESVRALNPRLIYCSITGYGQDGPKSGKAGHDLNYLAETGLLALSSGTPATPVVPPALIADIAGGALPAVLNILLALEARRQSGDGCSLDIAMADNLFPFMYWALGAGLATGRWPGNGADLVTGGTPRYRLYPTSDGQLVAAAPIEQKFWEAFCRAIGLPAEEADDASDPAGVTERVAALIARKPARHWQATLDAADCCCSIVRDLERALADPHFAARGLFDHRLEVTSGKAIPALPVPVDKHFRAAGSRARAPRLGEHNNLAPARRT